MIKRPEGSLNSVTVAISSDARVATEGLSTPQPQLLIRPTTGLSSLQLQAIWQYRELLYFLVWRDIKVRYKQTILGMLWIVVQPIVSIVIFSGLFGILLGVPTGDVPYPVFAIAALLPWQYFAGSLTRSSSSLVDNAHVITKVYFPRIVLPIAGVLAGLIDFAVSFVVLTALLLYYGISVSPTIILLPFFILMAMFTALGFGLWLSALNVRYRDIKHLLPFIVQTWMYVTPVIYGSSMIPERFQFLLALNPMTGVVEGFRWALLHQQLNDATPLGLLFPISIVVTLVVLISGMIVFRTTERSFADII